MSVKQSMCIVGLGLMGGSLALALKRSGWSGQIIGVSRGEETLRAAHATGAIDVGYTTLATGIPGADIVVLATPVRTLLAQLDELSRYAKDGAIIMDLGSSKAEVCAAMAWLPEHLQPLGGHPMCGKETGGFASADAELYAGKTFVLCPLPRTSEATLETARALAEAVGSCAVVLDPVEHDRAVAAISHLPYLAAASLVNAVAAGNDPHAPALAASGFRDTTRIASSDANMMLDILLTNRSQVLEWLDLYQGELSAVRAALQAGDEDGLRERLANARAVRGAFKF